MKEKFDVTGMSCSACSSHVEKSVSKLEGIKTVSVNLLTNSMQVEYDETKLDTGKIIEAVEHAGYGASVKEDGKAAVKAGETENAVSIQQKNIKNMKTRLIISVIFLMPLMYVSMGHMIYNALGVPMPPLTMKFSMEVKMQSFTHLRNSCFYFRSCLLIRNISATALQH